VELESGQSFVIAGLLNNQVTEQFSKMPGLANIPLFGKLFQSRTLTKSNSELLVVVTPELVRPIPAGVKIPDVSSTIPFLKDAPSTAPRQPGAAVTGAAPMLLKRDTVPFEELKSSPPVGGAGAQPSSGPGLSAAQPLPGALGSGDQGHQ
jgi:pilus assembly protein CpaC